MRSTLFLALLVACTGAPTETADAPPSGDAKAEAKAFLDAFYPEFQTKYLAWQEAEWTANTRIVDGDETAVKAQEAQRGDYAKFVGSVENVEKVRALLERRAELDPLQVRELEAILYQAAPNAQIAADKVSALIAAEANQTKTLYGYTFKVDGKEVTPNDIDEVLMNDKDVGKRQKVWEASKAHGPSLKPGLIELQKLRNGVVQASGYEDYYAYQVSGYGMTKAEMDELLARLIDEIWPLYRELHTWARHELAGRFKQPVPDQIPAHWLPNRWGQSWDALVEVEGFDLDAALKGKEREWIVKEGEAFYVSMGFDPLPATFYEKSSLYPVEKDAGYHKNTHASAWHMDYDKDVRSLMSIEPNGEWYLTSMHELGHIYYYQSYSRPEVPLILREGANRAFHEAVGTQMGLAARQKPFLVGRGLVDAKVKSDDTQAGLQQALDYVVFMPFSVGTMTGFERALYAENLPPEQYNAKWWELVKRYQGVVPPTERGEDFADALTKTHINDDAGQYYDYALSTIILFQLHEHIARDILKQDVHATNYWGSQEAGAYLKGILQKGATEDWRTLMKDSTGSDISAEPMIRYYEPVMAWLKGQNKGRTHTLPEHP